MVHHALIVALATSLVSVGNTLSATPITRYFSGVITTVPDGSGLPIQVGDSIVGHFNWDADTLTIDPDVDFPDLKQYIRTSPINPNAFVVRIGDYIVPAFNDEVFVVALLNDSQLQQYTNPPGEPYQDALAFGRVSHAAFLEADDELLNGEVFGTSVAFYSLDLSRLPSPELSSAERVDAFAEGEFNLFVGVADASVIQGTIQLHAVPEPSSLLLLGLGATMAGAGFRLRALRPTTSFN